MGTHAGQIVLVTGASRGIGRAVAEHFGGAGATIIAVARNKSQLEDLARTITERGGVCRPYAVDLADLEVSPGPVRTDMGLFANKGDGNGMVAPEAILPMFDMLADPGLRHTGQMFEFRHFQGSKPLEVWTVRRY